MKSLTQLAILRLFEKNTLDEVIQKLESNRVVFDICFNDRQTVIKLVGNHVTHQRTSRIFLQRNDLRSPEELLALVKCISIDFNAKVDDWEIYDRAPLGPKPDGNVICLDVHLEFGKIELSKCDYDEKVMRTLMRLRWTSFK